MVHCRDGILILMTSWGSQFAFSVFLVPLTNEFGWDYMNVLANYAQCHTTITSAPFVKYFNTGQGDRYFRDGSHVSSKKWSDMGQQDMLPTYRENLSFAYMTHTTGELPWMWP
jgi:hypothetical protein